LEKLPEFGQKSAAVTPEYIFEIVVRYRWLILIPLCISLSLGFAYTLIAPRTYEATTSILIQPQRVPTEYVQSIVSENLNRRLDTIARQILSRTNLEKIIEQFGLYKDAEDMYLEDKVGDLRQRISVKIDKPSQGGQTTNIFNVSFKGETPEQVMRITNTLAGYFMDENLKIREAQAVGTSEFLDSELLKLQEKLEEKEKILSEYRSKHLGGLPDELESNLRTLDRMQEQQSAQQAAVLELKNSLTLLESQISKAKQEHEELLNEENILTGGLSELEQKLAALKIQLDDLRSKYTEKHPDIKKMLITIETTEKRIKEEQNSDSKDSESEIQGPVSLREKRYKKSKLKQFENYIFEQKLQSKKIHIEIQKYERAIEETKKKMALYYKRVEETPKREQEIQSLQRDYSNIRENYKSLLARKLESDIAVNMEKKQKGEQFRILDPARIPEKPVSPDIRKLLMFSLAVGLGLGGGLSFAIEFLFDKSVKTVEEAEAEFGLPVLAILPNIKHSEKTVRKKTGVILFSCAALYALGVLVLFTIIYLNGIERTIRSISVYFNF